MVTVKKGDMMQMPNEYSLAHCISADCAMGIKANGERMPCAALSICDAFPLNRTVCESYRFLGINEIGSVIPVVLFIHNGVSISGKRYILNMITKQNYWNKPTPATFRAAVTSLKNYCVEQGIKKLAVPPLGTVHDKLSWEFVKQVLEEYFNDTDIEVVVCFL